MSILEKIDQGIRTTSPEEMREVGRAIALSCPENVSLALSGDLGAGKTMFVKGLAQGWNIAATVTSPTFNLFSIYSGDRQLVHMDAYRLESADQVESLMIEDFLRPPYCLVVEWPEKVEGWLPREAWWLRFTIAPDESHWVRRETCRIP
jgi:tRNA threonylcarbamoyladenosine biosynthesis protein TsaE